jgi:excisionase family DNA binding protein
MSGKIPFSERHALRIDEATQYSGLGKTSIYDAIRAGQIEATKIGKRRLVFRESLDKFLDESVNSNYFWRRSSAANHGQ